MPGNPAGGRGTTAIGEGVLKGNVRTHFGGAGGRGGGASQMHEGQTSGGNTRNGGIPTGVWGEEQTKQSETNLKWGYRGENPLMSIKGKGEYTIAWPR